MKISLRFEFDETEKDRFANDFIQCKEIQTILDHALGLIAKKMVLDACDLMRLKKKYPSKRDALVKSTTDMMLKLLS